MRLIALTTSVLLLTPTAALASIAESPTSTPYVAPSAQLSAECGQISGLLIGGSEEEWFQLIAPDGFDLWGAALTLQPDESRDFIQDVEFAGIYELYTSPRFPTDSASTLRASVEVTCGIPHDEPTDEPAEEVQLGAAPTEPTEVSSEAVTIDSGVATASETELADTGPAHVALLLMLSLTLLSFGRKLTKAL